MRSTNGSAEDGTVARKKLALAQGLLSTIEGIHRRSAVARTTVTTRLCKRGASIMKMTPHKAVVSRVNSISGQSAAGA